MPRKAFIIVNAVNPGQKRRAVVNILYGIGVALIVIGFVRETACLARHGQQTPLECSAGPAYTAAVVCFVVAIVLDRL